MIIKDCDSCPFRDGRPVVQLEGNILVIIKDRDPQDIGSTVSGVWGHAQQRLACDAE